MQAWALLVLRLVRSVLLAARLVRLVALVHRLAALRLAVGLARRAAGHSTESLLAVALLDLEAASVAVRPDQV